MQSGVARGDGDTADRRCDLDAGGGSSWSLNLSATGAGPFRLPSASAAWREVMAMRCSATAGAAGVAEPLMCDELGELETCMGLDERSSSSRGAVLPGGGRLQRAMQLAQLAQEKMRGLRKKQPAVESSLTFSDAEREVGSAEWCGLQCGADATPTQLAAAQWAERNKCGGPNKKDERSESASVTSAAETVRGREREREREPVSSLTHTVTSNDNICGLCLKFDISVEELLAVNKPASRTSLLARKTINVPVFADLELEKREEPLTLAFTDCHREQAPRVCESACAATRQEVTTSLTRDDSHFQQQQAVQGGTCSREEARMKWQLSDAGVAEALLRGENADSPGAVLAPAPTPPVPSLRLPSF